MKHSDSLFVSMFSMLTCIFAFGDGDDSAISLSELDWNGLEDLEMFGSLSFLSLPGLLNPSLVKSSQPTYIHSKACSDESEKITAIQIFATMILLESMLSL